MNAQPSILWTAQEAAAVTGGTTHGDWCATGVSVNADHVRPGDLFFASSQDDLAKIFEKGAVAAVIGRTNPMAGQWPVLSVPHVFEALYALARAARYKTHALVLAVQGREARHEMAEILSKIGRVHAGGRHLSLGLAGLPEDTDYGVFACSPVTQPDIAIITNCAAARRDTLLETMPRHGAVIINGDQDGFLPLLARAKAAGIQTILTYGRSKNADARILADLKTENGRRLSIALGRQDILAGPAVKDAGADMVAASLLVLGLAGKSTSLLSNTSREPDSQMVFRIKNMIDYGYGRQTALLDPLPGDSEKPFQSSAGGLTIPRALDSLDFVLATRRSIATVPDARAAIQKKFRETPEAIVPDVLMPGDFVVFKKLWDSSKTVFSDALRLTTGLKKVRI